LYWNDFNQFFTRQTCLLTLSSVHAKVEYQSQLYCFPNEISD
jgi:hypothetical protein